MTLTDPLARARARALQELAALAEHSPCVVSFALLDDATALLAFDLPYLTRDDPGSAPREACGFELGVSLSPQYPFEAPRIHFLSAEPIFHPAILASLPFVCVGHHAWSPDVGAAHFVALHVQVVVGAEPIDTLDALHGDPDSSDAARHYRVLQREGRLPLATPRLTLRSRDESGPGPPARAPHGADSIDAGSGVTLRGPMGRRSVEISKDGREARCRLSPSGVAPDARIARWLARRLEAEAAVRLSTAAGVELVLPLAAGEGAFEAKLGLTPPVRALELPLRAALRPEVADAVAQALTFHSG